MKWLHKKFAPQNFENYAEPIEKDLVHKEESGQVKLLEKFVN